MVREALTMQTLSALEPRDAAAYFIARRAEGLTSSEQQLLADWLASNEAHHRMFDSADRAWRSFANSADDEILAAMRSHARAPRPRSLPNWQPIAAVAAVLLLAVTAALSMVPGLNPFSPSVETIEYASVRGEVKELELPDGSTMTLDADSTATGRFGARVRTVELQRGRAYFDVKPEASRPFAVTAASRRIVAVGTSFDVNLIAGGLAVTLIEGKVEIGSVESAQTLVTLEPGQQYVELRGRGTVETIGAATQDAVTWRTGLVSFSDQTLAEAVAVMNRYSREQIVVRDPAVASLAVSGQLNTGDAELVARNLADMLGLEVVRRGDEIELVRRN